MKCLLLSALLFSVVCKAAPTSNNTLCGVDNRHPSKIKPIARLMGKLSDDSGCTATLISSSCMISAGHCNYETQFAQFNVPASGRDGKIKAPLASDEYEVERIVGAGDPMSYISRGDWVVFRLKPNAITGKNAGDIQGFYKISKTPIAQLIGQTIRVTGYGSSKIRTFNYAQQTSVGSFVAMGSGAGRMKYQVDTMPGNSGSALVLESTQEIIGIHNDSGCSNAYRLDGSYNEGTAISELPEFQSAIDQCLALEK